MISRTMLYLESVIVALLWSFVLYTPIEPGTNWMVVLFVSPVVALLWHITFLFLQVRIYQNPLENPAFEEVEGRADKRIEVISSAQIWVRSSEHRFITSTSNALYNAVIISEPMIENIVRHPDSGEVVLAFHMLRAKDRTYVDLLLTSAVFLILTFVAMLFVWPMIVGMIYMIEYVGLYFLILPLLWLALPAVLLAIIFRAATWRFDNTLNEIWRIYDVHPQVAKTQLEGGRDLSPEGVEAIVWSVKEWEKSRRYSRRIGLAMVAGASTFFIVNLFFPVMLFWYSTYGYWFYLGAVYGLPFLVGLSVFIICRYWDLKSMNEADYDLKDVHEPIWLGQDLWDTLDSKDNE
jgi:hypothetical protein